MPGVPAENQKTQVTGKSRYEVFGESGWRESIRLVKLLAGVVSLLLAATLVLGLKDPNAKMM